jgi:methionyl-tRNA formyltransferase
MRIAFFWTWDFSKNILSGMIAEDIFDIVLVVSQNDKPVWRKKIIQKTPVKVLSEHHWISVEQPEKLFWNTQFFELLDNYQLDFIVVVAYGKIVPSRVLQSPKYWCINLHGSILPLYRGASPIQEALKNWDTKTWLTVMYMSKWMDEWDILKIGEILIDWMDTTVSIFEKFSAIWVPLLLDVLPSIIQKKLIAYKQDTSKATYCSKIAKVDGEISFSCEKSSDIYNKFRAYCIWPWIHCYYNTLSFSILSCEIFNWDDSELWIDQRTPGEVIKIHKKLYGVICRDKKILILREVKLAGKKSMDILSFINGNKSFLDYKF